MVSDDDARQDKDGFSVFFFQAEDGIRDYKVTGVQTCALPICPAAYATRQQWQHWIAQALAFNPHAKATPPKKRKPQASEPAPADAKTPPAPPAPAGRRTRKHPIFGDE